jgi:hypothetical protein
MLTANEPLVGPLPVSAGSWPANRGNDGGSASQIFPNSVVVVVGSSIEALTAGFDGPPGTGVRLGSVAVDAALVADDDGERLAVGLQAAASRPIVIATIATEMTWAARP